MADDRVPVPGRPPVPVLVTGVLGLVGAALAALTAFFVLALGGLSDDDGSGGRWLLALFLAAAGQAWGAVRLLLGRGRLLLAMASLPGLLPLAALIGIWLEYHQQVTLLEVLAALPVVTLVLTLTPPVRRWVAGSRSPARGAEQTLPSGD